MAKITYTSAAPDYFSGFVPQDFQSYSIAITGSRTTARITYVDPTDGAASVLVLKGTGLSADDTGFISGTVTSLTASNGSGPALYTITGLSLAAFRLEPDDGWNFKGLLLSGNDRIIGSSHGDAIETGAGNDTVSAGAGDDIIRDHLGADIYDGGAGSDLVDFSLGYSDAWFPSAGVSVDLAAGSAVDAWGSTNKLKNIEAVRGTVFSDTLTGSDASTAEYFQGLAGDDTIDGGAGLSDRVDYSADSLYGGRRGVSVDLGRGKAIDSFGDVDTLLNIEDASGGRYADKILGSKGANHLRGGGGDDMLTGKGGNDILEGEGGNDTLTGANGSADVFLFRDRGDVNNLGTDQIRVFKDGEDIIRFQNVDGVESVSDLSMSQDGQNVIINYTMGTILVESITVSKLTAADFLFV